MLSNRRKAASMDGEHKPVKCYEDGEYKEISTAEIKKFCTGQAEKEGSTFLEPKPEERDSKETSTILGPKEIVKKTDKQESGINYSYNFTAIYCVIGTFFLLYVW